MHSGVKLRCCRRPFDWFGALNTILVPLRLVFIIAALYMICLFACFDAGFERMVASCHFDCARGGKVRCSRRPFDWFGDLNTILVRLRLVFIVAALYMSCLFGSFDARIERMVVLCDFDCARAVKLRCCRRPFDRFGALNSSSV